MTAFNGTAQLQKVLVNGAELTYQQRGQGEVILFVHGTQEDLRVFTPQSELLSDRYKVISYSRRYNYPNSNSFQSNTPFSALTEAEDLAAFIQELQIAPVHLVGHSFGGLIAMMMAQQNPELIATLTLSEPAAVSWLPDIPECSNWYDSLQINLLHAVGKAFETGDTTEIMKQLFVFFAGRDLQNQLPPQVLEALKVNLTEIKALVNAKDPFSHANRRLLSDFNKPVMLLSAGNTMPMIACINEEMKSIFPEATRYHLPEASHDFWMTHPEELSEYLRAFLNP